MDPRLVKLFETFDPANTGDDEIYPNTLRNVLASRLNGTKIPLAGSLGLNEELAIPKESLADQKRFVQNFPENVAGSTMGITRAEEVLGRQTGKAMNALANSIKDSAPQAEHIANLKAIQELRKSPELLQEFLEAHLLGTPSTDAGAFKNVHIGDKKVIKQFRPEEFTNDMVPQSIQEQLIFNKLDGLNPNSKTYKTTNNIYQVQDKVTPYDKTSHSLNDWEDQTSILNQMVRDKGLGPSDLSNPSNHGLTKQNTPKIMDVGAFDNVNKMSSNDVKNLQNTYKTLPSDRTDFINEVLKLRQGK